MSLKKNLAMVLMALIAIASGCDKKSGVGSPQKALSDYVAQTFAVKVPEDKAKLVGFTTGEVKGALEKLDDEEFKRNFINEKKDFVSLKIRDERTLADSRVSITYEISYVNKSANSQDKVTNKKHALFVNEGGKWLIAEVRNLKTFIEHQNEMSF